MSTTLRRCVGSRARSKGLIIVTSYMSSELDTDSRCMRPDVRLPER